MQTKKLKHVPFFMGPQTKLAYVRFAPDAGGAAPVINESHGFSGVTRSSTGTFVATLDEQNIKDITVLACWSRDQDGVTNYHKYEATPVAPTAGTVTIKHYACAYSAIASGPALSDTSNAIALVVLVRTAS